MDEEFSWKSLGEVRKIQALANQRRELLLQVQEVDEELRSLVQQSDLGSRQLARLTGMSKDTLRRWRDSNYHD